MNTKRIITFIFLLFSFQNLSFGQSEESISFEGTPKSTMEDSIKIAQNEVFVDFEVAPEFPGGNDSLMRFIRNNLNYPKDALENGDEGTIYVSFVVEKDGSISNIIIRRSFHQSCSEEAIRVIGLMPRWKPGRQRGKLVRCQFVLPIKFKLT